jgi:hypothetical protein
VYKVQTKSFLLQLSGELGASCSALGDSLLPPNASHSTGQIFLTLCHSHTSHNMWEEPHFWYHLKKFLFTVILRDTVRNKCARDINPGFVVASMEQL